MHFYLAPLGKVDMDPQEELKKIIKETGDVSAKYGGYEITVLNPDRFPWHRVFQL